MHKINTVKEGAEFLDVHVENWWEKINIQKLDMIQGEKCILGQLYGNYYRGLDQLGLSVGYVDAFTGDASKNEWIKEISLRREPKAGLVGKYVTFRCYNYDYIGLVSDNEEGILKCSKYKEANRPNTESMGGWWWKNVTSFDLITKEVFDAYGVPKTKRLRFEVEVEVPVDLPKNLDSENWTEREKLMSMISNSTTFSFKEVKS